MKIIAMIPARYSASRFPGKLMQDLGGESVILRTYKATMNTKLFSEVYVVTCYCQKMVTHLFYLLNHHRA